MSKLTRQQTSLSTGRSLREKAWQCESTNCGVRYCDFKSRLQAFMAGYNHSK